MELTGDERKSSCGQRRSIGYARAGEAGQGGVLAPGCRRSAVGSGWPAELGLVLRADTAACARAPSFVDWTGAATGERWGRKPDARLIKQGR